MKKIVSTLIVCSMFFSCISAFASTEKYDAWKYSSNFDASATTEMLADDGIFFSEPDDVSFENGYVALNSGSGAISINPETEFAGDYTVEIGYKAEGGLFSAEINKNGNSFYKVSIENGAMKLVKVTDSSETVLSEVSYSISDDGINILKISQLVLDNGIKLNVADESGSVLECTDSEAWNRGIASVVFDKCSNAELYYVNVYSTPSAEMYNKNRTLIDISDWRGESFESLAQKGLTISGASIIKAHEDCFELRNGGGGAYFAPAETGVISGSYTAEFAIRWNYNKPGARFNMNGAEYYDIVKETETVDSTTYYLYKIIKVTASGKETVAETRLTKNLIADTYTTRTYKITVDKSVSPAKLTVVISDATGSVTIEGTDSSPLADGKAGVYFAAVGQPRLVSFKCVQKQSFGGTCENGNGGTYTNSDGKLISLDDELLFYVNGELADAASKGKISIEMPVKRLGSYVVAAVLYEDYAMTDMVMLTPEEFEGGKVEIFDTTSTKAEKSEVMVFVFDREDTLNSRTQIFELK